MLRFSIKELLAATMLIAIGAGLWSVLFRHSGQLHRALGELVFLPVVVLYFAGGAFISAGLGFPFRRELEGMLTGVAIQLMLLAVLVLALIVH